MFIALPAIDPATGKILRWVGTNTDIDEDKRKKEEQRYKLIAEAIPQIVWTAKDDGIKQCNLFSCFLFYVYRNRQLF